MGAMHINQGPGPLKIVKVVGAFDDGTAKKFPPYGRVRKIRFGMPTITLKEGATPRATFEQSVVLFAHRSKNPLITDALRFLALSPGWFGLYKVIKVVKMNDLSKVAGNRAGFKHIEDNGWATKAEIDAFKATAEHHRRWNSPAPRTSMDLIDARQLVGGIVRQWIVAVSRRPIAPAAGQEPPERHTPSPISHDNPVYRLLVMARFCL
jgi:hypothetical protein